MEQKTDFAASQSQTPPKTGHETGAQITQSATNGPQTPQNTPKTTRKTASKRGKTSRAKATNKTRAKSAPKTGEKAAKNTSKPVAKKAVSEVQIYEGVASQTLGESWGAGEEIGKDDAGEIAAPKPRTRLPWNVRQFITIYNAVGTAPKETRVAVKEVFGVDVSPSQVDHYNPTKAAGLTLCLDLKKLFRKAQREHQAMVIKAGISDKRRRMQLLHNMAEKSYESGNFPLAAQLLEQAAKEEGGLYTNKSLVQVDDKRAAMAKLLNCKPEDIPALQRLKAEGELREEAEGIASSRKIH